MLNWAKARLHIPILTIAICPRAMHIFALIQSETKTFTHLHLL